MKTNYRVRRKIGGPIGIVEKEYGSPDNIMAEVYWGITTDGAKGQPVKHVTKENLRDLEVVDFKIYSPEEVILRQAKQAEAASYVIEGSVIPVTDVTTPLLKKDLNGG